MTQSHTIAVAIGGVEVACIHAKDGGHERKREEDNRDDCEKHNGPSLENTFIGSFQSVFCLDDTRLLLFETEQVLQLLKGSVLVVGLYYDRTIY